MIPSLETLNSTVPNALDTPLILALKTRGWLVRQDAESGLITCTVSFIYPSADPSHDVRSLTTELVFDTRENGMTFSLGESRGGVFTRAFSLGLPAGYATAFAALSHHHITELLSATPDNSDFSRAFSAHSEPAWRLLNEIGVMQQWLLKGVAADVYHARH